MVETIEQIQRKPPYLENIEKLKEAIRYLEAA